MTSTRIDDRQLQPRKLPRQSRSQATVEAIVQAAAQVFELHGYAAGTTNRIAERAGVSIGTVYQYFPNKDAILVALAREHLAEGAEALQPALERLRSGARFDDVVADVVAAMVSLHARAPALHRVLFEETRLPQSLREELEALEEQTVEVVAAAIANDPTGNGGDPRLRARIAIGAIEGLTHRLVLSPRADADTDALAREITRLVCAYLRSAP